MYASSRTVEIEPPMEKERLKQIIVEVMKTVFIKYLQDNGENAE